MHVEDEHGKEYERNVDLRSNLPKFVLDVIAIN